MQAAQAVSTIQQKLKTDILALYAASLTAGGEVIRQGLRATLRETLHELADGDNMDTDARRTFSALNDLTQHVVVGDSNAFRCIVCNERQGKKSTVVENHLCDHQDGGGNSLCHRVYCEVKGVLGKKRHTMNHIKQVVQSSIAKVKNQVPSAITPAVEPSVLSAATSLQQPPPVIEAATLDPTIPLDPEHDWTDLNWIQDMLKLATDGTTRMDTN